METPDIPSVVDIDRQSFSLPWPESSYRYEVEDNKASQCLVAEDLTGAVVGMIVSWVIVDELHIATIAIHPGHRRKGIGSQLLWSALAHGSRAGANRAFLEVRARNEAAQAMYAKFGFHTTGVRANYYRDNGEDAILMTLEPLEVA